MKNDRMDSAVLTFTDALESLNASLKELDGRKSDEYYSIFEDAAVKRFEVAFEYFWKVLKIACEREGVEAYGPRPAIQEAVKFGWIDEPEFWAETLDARNGSVHDYFGTSREDYLKIVRKFAKASAKAVEKLKS